MLSIPSHPLSWIWQPKHLPVSVADIAMGKAQFSVSREVGGRDPQKQSLKAVLESSFPREQGRVDGLGGVERGHQWLHSRSFRAVTCRPHQTPITIDKAVLSAKVSEYMLGITWLYTTPACGKPFPTALLLDWSIRIPPLSPGQTWEKSDRAVSLSVHRKLTRCLPRISMLSK